MSRLNAYFIINTPTKFDHFYSFYLIFEYTDIACRLIELYVLEFNSKLDSHINNLYQCRFEQLTICTIQKVFDIKFS